MSISRVSPSICRLILQPEAWTSLVDKQAYITKKIVESHDYNFLRPVSISVYRVNRTFLTVDVTNSHWVSLAY